jgi:hypothetical protein
MNQQNNTQPNNQQPVIEDLTVNQARTEEVKGGTVTPTTWSWGLDRIDQR